MSRPIRWLGYAAAFLALWLGLLLFPLKPEPPLDLHVWLLPLYLLVAFGLYAVKFFVVGILQFENCEKSFQELQQEIKAAKTELRAKGFEFSN
eukprot:m.227459 g.227459  ORF g.227459 m.227459 type:complete len:93 (+) comp17219_c0_seq1:12-290(+)